jgi:hypothetical protein
MMDSTFYNRYISRVWSWWGTMPAPTLTVNQVCASFRVGALGYLTHFLVFSIVRLTLCYFSTLHRSSMLRQDVCCGLRPTSV